MNLSENTCRQLVLFVAALEGVIARGGLSGFDVQLAVRAATRRDDVESWLKELSKELEGGCHAS